MAFGRKKKAEDDLPEQPASSDNVLDGEKPRWGLRRGSGGDASSSAPARKKKYKDTLSSVLSASTPEAAVDRMRENETFLINGGKLAVIAVFEADAVGGISTKQKNDEEKGQFIELVRDDRIPAVITPQMLEDEKIGLIIDEDAWELMSELDFLVHAPYRWATVELSDSEELSIDFNCPPTTWDTISDVVHGDVNIMDALTVDETRSASSAPSATSADDTSVLSPVSASSAPDDEDGYEAYPELDDEDLPDYVATPLGEEAAPGSPVSPVSGASAVSAVSGSSGQSPASADSSELAQSAVSGPDDLEDDLEDDDFSVEDEEEGADVSDEYVPDDTPVPEEVVRSTIARRFRSSDLGLEIDMEPFESYFSSSEPMVLFPTDRESENPDDILVNYLNEISREANADLQRLRTEHLAADRRFYIEMMTDLAEDIDSRLSISDPNTHYGQLLASLKDERSRSQAESGTVINERRRAMRDDFDGKVRQVGEDARVAAEAAYRDRNLGRLERQMSEIETAVLRDIDDHYEVGRKDMQDARVDEAGRRFDLSMSRVLKRIAERREQQIVAEAERYGKWEETMRAFLEEHRVDDATRVEVLAEKLRQEDLAQQVRDEAAAKLAEFKAETETRISILTEQTRNAENEAARKIAEAEAGRQKDAAEAEKRYEELSREFHARTEENDKTWQARLDEADRKLSDTKEEMAKRDVEKVRNKRLFAVVAVVAAFLLLVLGACVGLVIGGHTGSGSSGQQPSVTIVNPGSSSNQG